MADAPATEAETEKQLHDTTIPAGLSPARRRAALELDSRDEPQLILRDARGQPRIRLRTRKSEAFVNLFDERGKVRLGLAIDEAGLPQVLLLDEDERLRYQLAVNSDGAPGMMFVAADGTICAGQGTDA